MIKLSSDRLGITLLRVVPGVEMVAIQKWLELIGDPEGADRKAAAFLTLGRSDIALIRQANIEEEPQPELHAGALDNVSCAKEFDCYVWQGRYSVQDVMNQRLCAMVFLRFNPDIADEPGFLEVECEHRLAEALCELRVSTGDVSWAFLGSYGRASNIILIGATEIGDLLMAAEEIIQAATTIDDDGPRPLLRETYTIVGMEWPGPGGEIDALRGQFQLSAAAEYFKDASLSLELRCCSADVLTLSRIALGEWTARVAEQGVADPAPQTSVTIAYGPSDVNVRFPLLYYQSFGTLVADLHRFRRLCGDVLLTSESQIEFRPGENGEIDLVEPFLDRRTERPLMVEIRPEQAKDILDSHQGAAGVLHSFYAYNHRLSDDGGEAVQDLFLYYKECSKLALKIARNRQNREPIAEDLRWLYVMLEEGQIGQIQRLDPFPMSRRAGTDLGPYRSGIRRRLWAAQAIPWYIFNELLNHDDSPNNEWRGFLIGGRLKNEFVTRPPVMMIPPESLPHPENWWVLSHESMHDYVERDELLKFDEEPWPDIQAELSKEFPRVVERQYFEYLVTECLCDMLEYLSLGAMTWQDQQRICWADVLDRLAADPGGRKEERDDFIAEHVLRTACAIWCAPECRGLSTAELLDELVNKVILPLQTEGMDVAVFFGARAVGQLYARLIQMCEAFKPATEWLLARNPFVEERQDERRTWAGEPYKQCAGALSDGGLVAPDDLKYPDLLVWFLRREWLFKPMPPQMASATTLSLLWFYLSRFRIA